MVLVVKTNPSGLPLRYYAVPPIAFVLAAIKAFKADIESSVIWRYHPDAVYVCVRAESGDATLYVEEPYCRRGVAEWLDEVDPFEVSEKFIRYSVDYNKVGLLIRASGPDAILEAVVYAPGVANLLRRPPIDAEIDIEYFSDVRVETFYDLFEHRYERYAEFVRALAEELEPIALDTDGRRVELPPTYFLERVDAAQDVYDHRALFRTVPVYRHHLVHSIIDDAMPYVRKLKRTVDAESAWNDIFDAIRRSFVWFRDLMMPRSVEAYKKFVVYVLRRLEGAA